MKEKAAMKTKIESWVKRSWILHTSHLHGIRISNDVKIKKNIMSPRSKWRKKESDWNTHEKIRKRCMIVCLLDTVLVYYVTKAALPLSKKLLKIANNSSSENAIPYIFSLFSGHLSSVTWFTKQFFKICYYHSYRCIYVNQSSRKTVIDSRVKNCQNSAP